MINDLILRVTYNGVVTDLDVDGDVPLRLDISAVDNQEIGEVFGISSQNFNLPGTAKNNKFFNHAYLQSAVDVPAMYDTIDCSVLRNGETLLLGMLQLNQVITSEDGFITYDVTVSNRVVEFNEALKDKFLYEGDWSPYNHTLNAENIIRSWNPRTDPNTIFYWEPLYLDSGLTGSVYYPWINYGFDSVYTWPNFPAISGTYGAKLGRANLSGSTSIFATPLNLAQLLPAVGAREVFDVIFKQAGFEYTSSFIESSSFDELYILTKNSDSLGVQLGPEQQNPSILDSFLEDNISMSASFYGQTTYYNLPFSGSVNDPGGNYNTSNYRYTAPLDGLYNIQVSIDFDNSANETDADKRTGYFAAYNTFPASGAPGFETNGPVTYLAQGDQERNKVTLSAVGVSLSAGDQIYGQFAVDNNNATVDTDPTPLYSSSFFKVTKAPLDYTNFPVTMSAQIDSEIKSIDMFKGLLTQFNLVAYPEQDQSKVIRLETFDTWMRQGETKDWTSKYNTAKRISIKNPVVEEPRELLFSNAEDEDRISKIAKDQTPNFQYGTLRTISTSNLTSGQKKVESLFAPTVLAPAVALTTSSFAGTQTFTLNFDTEESSEYIMPHLYKFENSEMKSYKFKPRIGYKSFYQSSGSANLGYQSTPLGSYGDLRTPNNQYMQSGSTTLDSMVFNYYSTLSNYKNYPVQDSTQDLLFNSTYTKFTSDPNIYLTDGTSNFTTYWKQYIDSIYWQDGRKIEVDLFFEEYEYQDIKLNDKIIIGDNAYRINKIKGFNLTRRDIVTVELLKLYPSFYPIVVPGTEACPTVSTYEAQDITSSSMLLTGSVDSTGSAVVERGFVLSDTDSTPEIGESGVTKYPTGSGLGHFDYPVTGLTPNNLYYYRAYASASDCLEYGDVFSSTTLTSSACPEVSTYPVQDITTSSFTMSGSVDAENGATIVERGFVYSSTDSTPTIGEPGVLKQTSSLTPSPGHFSGSVTGWSDNTNIYVRAYASSSGCEEYGTVQSGSTPQAFYAVTLEYGSVDCATVCANFGSNPSGTFYVDVGSGGSGVFAISSKIYTDAAGTTPAPANFYTDGTDCRDSDGVGNLGVTVGCGP